MEAGLCAGYLLTSLINLSLGLISWRLMFLIGIVPALLALYIRARLSEPENFKQIKQEREKAITLCKLGILSPSQKALESPLAILLSKDYLRTTLVVSTLVVSTLVVSTLAGAAIAGYGQPFSGFRPG